jgi:hypothetical protein
MFTLENIQCHPPGEKRFVDFQVDILALQSSAI